MSIKNRGFGSLKKNDPERFREITSRGGKKDKERFYDNPENARKAINKRWDKYRQLKDGLTGRERAIVAGRKGGQASRKK